MVNRMFDKIKTISLVCLFVGLAAVPVQAYSFIDASSSGIGIGVKWEQGENTASAFSTATPPGTPGGATWSIMDAGFSIDPAFGSVDHSTTTANITSLGVSGFGLANYETFFDDALNVWASASGFTNLGRVADGGVNAGAAQASGGHLGDIRIAAWDIDTANVLAHTFVSGTEAVFGTGGTIGGDAHFDTGFTWVDDASDVTGNGNFDLLTVAIHEFGHSLGLGHSTVSGSIMEAVYAGSRRTLHADDIAGIVALYGTPVPEPGTIVLLGIGVLGMVGYSRRRRRKPEASSTGIFGPPVV